MGKLAEEGRTASGVGMSSHRHPAQCAPGPLAVGGVVTISHAVSLYLLFTTLGGTSVHGCLEVTVFNYVGHFPSGL